MHIRAVQIDIADHSVTDGDPGQGALDRPDGLKLSELRCPADGRQGFERALKGIVKQETAVQCLRRGKRIVDAQRDDLQGFGYGEKECALTWGGLMDMVTDKFLHYG